MKFDFLNKNNETLSGRLDLPEGTPKAFAIFAHCFTCSKNLSVTSTISRSLSNMGIATLRFDFTGLGNSDGDFSNTNFSSNVQDLISACQALKEKYQAPQILIGHSLGGAAVLKASTLLNDIQAVATIAAPSQTEHVEKLFKEDLPTIEKNGEAQVELEGRSFKIKKQFIDDLNSSNILDDLNKQKKAFLILHSPVDNTVSINHAAKIYDSLKHPKSFISLGKADHLLSDRKMSQYVAKMISTWLEPYVSLTSEQDSELSKNPIESTKAKHLDPKALNEGQILVRSQKNKNFTQDIFTKDHHLIADEPLSFQGDNLGPNPYAYLLAALGSCTSMTIKMYARRKSLALEDVEVLLEHEKIHAKDCEDCEGKSAQVDVITKSIKLIGDLSQEQKDKLYEIAEKCPVNKTLKSDIKIQAAHL